MPKKTKRVCKIQNGVVVEAFIVDDDVSVTASTVSLPGKRWERTKDGEDATEQVADPLPLSAPSGTTFKAHAEASVGWVVQGNKLVPPA